MLRHRLRSNGGALFRAVRPKICGSASDPGTSKLGQFLGIPVLKKKASNTMFAVQDTFLSTKQVFENHRVVFTVGTTVASILTAWAGYALREMHNAKVEKRLESLEASLKRNYNVEHEHIKEIVKSGNVSTAACMATAWTTLVIGYGLGWRGGAWYTRRRFKREQLKMMGNLKQQRWQILKKPFARFRRVQSVHNTGENTTEVHTLGDLHPINSKQVNKTC